jgi:hypothetical protein
MRRRLLVLSLMCPALAAPSAAAGAGFPVVGLDTTQTGATAPADPFRYVALPSGSGTVVVKIDRAGGRTVRHRTLTGTSVVAAVAQDASTTGLSADGSTLVLTAERRAFPARATRLTVLDTATLRPERRLRLRGDFGLDGVSPDGSRLFLIQYRGSPSDYAVRAYDVARRRLLPRPIVDPREPDEKMTGFPITRSPSADGRWQYTLYQGTDHPFVHALDTARGRAFCVDVPGLLPDEIGDMRLAVRHGRVDVVDRAGAAVRRIDARTFRVSEVRPPAAPARAAAPGDDPSSGGFPWGLAAAVAALGAVAGLLLRRRYAAGTDSADSRAASSSTPTVP